MKPFAIDKSASAIAIIILLVAGAGMAFYFAIQSNAIEDAIHNDLIINILFVLEMEGRPVSTQLLFYYPTTRRGAILDVPAETALIIKSLDRMDRIDALYKAGSPEAYAAEIGRLTGTDIRYTLVLDIPGFVQAVDILDGLEFFIPNPISAKGEGWACSLPSGALTLDGDKMASYAMMNDPDEPEVDRVSRRQKIFQAFIKRIGQKADYLARPAVFDAFSRRLKTNLGQASLSRVLAEFAKLDADRIVMQRLTGTYRRIDGKLLLFPQYDGELVRDIVKQTLNALVKASTFSLDDKIYTVEILNGTSAKGLAKKTAEIFQSFGFDVLSVDNAESEDYDRTTIVDRIGNQDAATTIANVIRCKSITRSMEAVASATADFVVILGKDFNGRYCAE